MNIVGYLIHERPGEFTGQRGLHYSYVMAGNGVFIMAENHLVTATIRIGAAQVRGLAPLQQSTHLIHGRIPRQFFGDILRAMMQSMTRELYDAVVWEEGQYRLRMPEKDAGAAHVTYQQIPHKILDMHSHPTMTGKFSSIDDRDEVGVQLYGVIGHLDQAVPDYSFRLGVHGYFRNLDIGQVFDGFSL